MLNSNVKKICNFYAGDGHFLTTVIPYLILKSEINNRVVLLAKDFKKLESEIELFIDRYFPDFSLKFWENVKIINPNFLKSSDIGTANIICIKDSFEYNILDSLILYINVELIRCYPLGDNDFEVSSLINDNEFILNTRGIFKTSEVFSIFNDFENRNLYLT